MDVESEFNLPVGRTELVEPRGEWEIGVSVHFLSFLC